MFPHKLPSLFVSTGAALAALSLNLPLCLAQDAVPAGKGSYASAPPPSVAGKAQKVEGRVNHILVEDARPIPSQKWYMSLIVKQFGLGLWTYPMVVNTNAQGLQIFYPTQFKPDGSSLVTDNPLLVGGQGFAAPDGTWMKDWSDWTASFRFGKDPAKYIDVTMGQGMPYVWAEYHGVQPTIGFGAGAKGGAGGTGAQFFGAGGASASLPVTGDTLGITYGGRSYAVFAPAGSKFESGAGGVNVTLGGPKQFLVVCALPDAKSIDTFHKYAFAIPRSTTYSWKYDPAAGTISTNWKINAEPLQGKSTDLIQGWLAHQYRTNIAPVSYDGPTYLTPKGQMKSTIGNNFTFTYRYAGIVPNLPAPKAGTPGYDPAVLTTLIGQYGAKPTFGGDTYGGGKDLLKSAQYAFMAQQIKDPSYEAIRGAVVDALTNWFTYTTGEGNKFFAYYPHSKALVGFGSSYGSETFTDNHFHYGYFTMATGMIAAQDPKFAADYGPMATLVAKQYANWDRNDKRFPFLRTFDIWAGHSWASASANDAGVNNQESSSEAMNSWEGLIYLGQALGNADMLATGIMGYTTESQAVLEYWFNWKGDIFSPNWPHPITSVVYSGNNGWHTWFTGDYGWFYGIQWIPSSPGASYFVQDPAWAKKNFDNFLRIKAEQLGKKNPAAATQPVDLKQFGGELASYMIGYIMMYDPKATLDKFNEWWAQAGDKIAHNPWMTNVYYEAASLLSLGRPDFTSHLASPTSMVYVNDATKARTFLVWNPLTKPQAVKAYVAGKLAGQVVAAPGGLTAVTSLQPAR